MPLRFPLPAARRAFTLVELLAVIAIVGVLVALVFVGVGTLRQRADAAVCMSNMRQVGQAVLMSTADNKGRFPVVQAIPGLPDLPWADFVMPYLGGDAVQHNLKYAASSRHMRCPSQRKTMLELNNKNSEAELELSKVRNFAMNSSLSPIPGLPNRWKTVASVVKPSRTILLSEAGITSSTYGNITILNDYWLSYSTLDTSGNLRPGVHSGANNIVWCDGHVSRWEDINRLRVDPYRAGGAQDAWTGN